MRSLLACVIAAVAASAAAQKPVEKSEWEKEQERRNWKETDIKLPALAAHPTTQTPTLTKKPTRFVTFSSLAGGQQDLPQH